MSKKQKRPSSRSKPKIVGTSAGGSRLLKYGGKAFKPKMGVIEESAIELVELREEIYAELFGECESVFHEFIPYVPHVDVYLFPPREGRPYFTYVTGGMSNLPMASPKELGAESRRVELVFYSAVDKPEYASILRRLAHFPHDNATWLHWYHSMPNGFPAEPIFSEGQLDSFFFMPSIVEPDLELGKRLSYEGEPVNLVWCVPITAAECTLKLEKGTDALLDVFNVNAHPFIFDSDRASYV